MPASLAPIRSRWSRTAPFTRSAVIRLSIRSRSPSSIPTPSASARRETASCWWTIPARYQDTMGGAPGKGHSVSGNRRAQTLRTQDAAGLTFTLALRGKQVTCTTPTGEKLEGMIDGSAAPWVGGQGGTGRDHQAGAFHAAVQHHHRRQADRRVDACRRTKHAGDDDRQPQPAARHDIDLQGRVDLAA